MTTIGEVNLTERHENQWKFSDRSGTLLGDQTNLSVTDGSESWEFKCNKEEDGKYCISGSDWRSFVKQNTGSMLTLYAKEDDDDFHRIRVR